MALWGFGSSGKRNILQRADKFRAILGATDRFQVWLREPRFKSNVFPIISGGRVACSRVLAASGCGGEFTQPLPPILWGKRYSQVKKKIYKVSSFSFHMLRRGGISVKCYREIFFWKGLYLNDDDNYLQKRQLHDKHNLFKCLESHASSTKVGHPRLVPSWTVKFEVYLAQSRDVMIPLISGSRIRIAIWTNEPEPEPIPPWNWLQDWNRLQRWNRLPW